MKGYNILHHFALCLIGILAFSNTESICAATSRPSLVVGIVVNGLDAGEVETLSESMSPNGFKRVLSGSTIIQNLNFPENSDDVASTTLLMTGVDWHTNGIPSKQIFDREASKSLSAYYDKTYLGNFTDATLSAAHMTCSSISDEVKISGGRDCVVHSISSNPERAISLAGHLADSGIWIETVTGKWATTTYYKNVPSVLNTINYNNPLSSRIDTMSWRPVYPMTKYPLIGTSDAVKSFFYTFKQSSVDCYNHFVETPLANREITNLAINYIKALNIGNHRSMDMLSLNYSLQPYRYSQSRVGDIEKFDAYLRLDADISCLLSAIDKEVGLSKTFLFIVGTPPIDNRVNSLSKSGLPSGEFSVKRALSLLNMYLAAKYGHENWALGYLNRQIFLNRDALEKRPNQDAIKVDACRFLSKMTGVVSAQLIESDTAFKFYHDLYQGDIFLSILPGWIIVDEMNRDTEIVRSLPTTSFACVYNGNSPSHSVISDCFDASSFAGYICQLLKISPPNGAKHSSYKLK